MKTAFMFVVMLFGSLLVLDAQVISNPIDDFLGQMTRPQNSKLFKITVPNRNGGVEVLLSYSGWVNGRAGYEWVAYAPVNGGYQRLDDAITFKKDTLAVGTFKELGGTGMLTFFPDAGGKGSLIGYVFDGTNVQELNLGTVKFSGSDSGVAGQYFTDANRPTIEITPASNLPQ